MASRKPHNNTLIMLHLYMLKKYPEPTPIHMETACWHFGLGPFHNIVIHRRIHVAVKGFDTKFSKNCNGAKNLYFTIMFIDTERVARIIVQPAKTVIIIQPYCIFIDKDTFSQYRKVRILSAQRAHISM